MNVRDESEPPERYVGEPEACEDCGRTDAHPLICAITYVCSDCCDDPPFTHPPRDAAPPTGAAERDETEGQRATRHAWEYALNVKPPGAAEDQPSESVCPSPDCMMCSGEACNKCGAGCWSKRRDCEHDSAERHEEPVPHDGITAPLRAEVARVQEELSRANGELQLVYSHVTSTGHRGLRVENGRSSEAVIALIKECAIETSTLRAEVERLTRELTGQAIVAETLGIALAAMENDRNAWKFTARANAAGGDAARAETARVREEFAQVLWDLADELENDFATEACGQGVARVVERRAKEYERGEPQDGDS